MSERLDYQQQADDELRRLQEENVLYPCPQHPEREQLDPGVSTHQCCAECYQRKLDAYAGARPEPRWMTDATDLSTDCRTLQAATSAFLQSRRS